MQKKIIESYILSSEEKVFLDSRPSVSMSCATVLSNESYYFTYAYRALENNCIPISISVACDGVDVSVYRIDNVCVEHTESGFEEVGTENRAPGAFPDVLLPRSAEPHVVESGCVKLPFYEKGERALLNATHDAMKAVLVGINEDEKPMPSGKREVKITVRALDSGEILSEDILALNILDEKLPELDFYYTNWVHYDCIADIHGVEIWSDRYFEILASYLKSAKRYGMTLLLTPAFTPPLDTYVGGVRMKAQLVGIEKSAGKYTFDFTLLQRFIELAKSVGFRKFEHSHLFTQWGAAHAPNIYITENGQEKLYFGWETDASGEEYRNFLAQYIPAFKSEAKRLGVDLFWHISDEPTPDVERSYALAVDAVDELLRGERSGDALSDIVFYKGGLVKTPIVSIDCVHKFFGKCEKLWGYYTGGYYGNHTTEKCTNRLITDKPYRTRISGLHFYKYKLEGFLHWGYNFYYDRMSTGIYDPKSTPSAYKNLPGAAFIVYPWLDSCAPSLRAVYMKKSLTDLRALNLLESYVGYDEVIRLCESFFGEEISAQTMPKDADEMLRLREMINCEILKHKK